MSENNKYGLILKDKTKGPLSFQSSRNVFGSDSDSEDGKQKLPLLLKPSSNINRQAKVTQEKALVEDPTVYQYDEIYDSMIKEKEAKKEKTSVEKKPKYIENLIKTANKRKLENERRIERQIQKEREKEGEEFADKEVFVTSAYKKKLEEMRIEEEKEKYEEYLESIGDVTKQNDLGGFYRHLYEQKLGPKKPLETDEKKDTSKEDNVELDEPVFKKSKSIDDKKVKETKQRNYRKRKSSNDNKLSEGEIEDSEEEINRCNLDDLRKSKQTAENIDADSDFSIDESSDEESNKEDQQPKETEMVKSESESKKLEDSKTPSISKDIPKEEKVLEKPKEKIDIWKKRTVGEVFEQALKRYYERKAARGSH